MARLVPGKHACPKCGASPLVLAASMNPNAPETAVCSVCGSPFLELERMLSSVDIRVSSKQETRFRKLYEHSAVDHDLVALSIDPAIKTPLIMVHTDGVSRQWTSGRNHVESFLRLGYVDIRGNCPFRHRRCIGARCSLSVLRNNARDCALVWLTIT